MQRLNSSWDITQQDAFAARAMQPVLASSLDGYGAYIIPLRWQITPARGRDRSSCEEWMHKFWGQCMRHAAE